MQDHKTIRAALEYAQNVLRADQRTCPEKADDLITEALAALDRIEAQKDTVHIQFTQSGNGVLCRKWDFVPFEGSEPVKIGQLIVEAAAQKKTPHNARMIPCGKKKRKNGIMLDTKMQ